MNEKSFRKVPFRLTKRMTSRLVAFSRRSSHRFVWLKWWKYDILKRKSDISEHQMSNSVCQKVKFRNKTVEEQDKRCFQWSCYRTIVAKDKISNKYAKIVLKVNEYWTNIVKYKPTFCLAGWQPVNEDVLQIDGTAVDLGGSIEQGGKVRHVAENVIIILI